MLIKIKTTEKSRAEETGGLKAQIEQLLTASVATQDEARKLSATVHAWEPGDTIS